MILEKIPLIKDTFQIAKNIKTFILELDSTSQWHILDKKEYITQQINEVENEYFYTLTLIASALGLSIFTLIFSTFFFQNLTTVLLVTTVFFAIEAVQVIHHLSGALYTHSTSTPTPVTESTEFEKKQCCPPESLKVAPDSSFESDGTSLPSSDCSENRLDASLKSSNTNN
jgi:hypothetical protein